MSSSNPDPLKLFTHQDLTPLPTDRKPTFEEINTLQKQASANARAIDSSRGSGKHGLLFLVTGKEKYRIIAGVNFHPPTKPATSFQIREGASNVEVQTAKSKYEAEVLEWNSYNHTEKALHTQLIKAVPRTLISTLADAEDDLSDVDPHAIMSHLWSKYGSVTSKMLQDNLTELQEPWDINNPIEELWARVKRCQLLASKGKEANSRWSNSTIHHQQPQEDRSF